jgi:hypothetical protein
MEFLNVKAYDAYNKLLLKGLIRLKGGNGSELFENQFQQDTCEYLGSVTTTEGCTHTVSRRLCSQVMLNYSPIMACAIPRTKDLSRVKKCDMFTRGHIDKQHSFPKYLIVV